MRAAPEPAREPRLAAARQAGCGRAGAGPARRPTAASRGSATAARKQPLRATRKAGRPGVRGVPRTAPPFGRREPDVEREPRVAHAAAGLEEDEAARVRDPLRARRGPVHHQALAPHLRRRDLWVQGWASITASRETPSSEKGRGGERHARASRARGRSACCSS